MRKKLCKILVTGGAGFIGSEFVRQGVQAGYKLIVVDALSYAGDLGRLADVSRDFSFYKVDISRKERLEMVFRKEKPGMIVHFAAETHVDRSIQDVGGFIRTNIIGTQNLIDLARHFEVTRFVHLSTDEVYGQSFKGQFSEDDPIKPRNPYSATKASAELLIRAAMETYHFPAIIVRPANNYGPWQYPEKFLPVIISRALQDQPVPVYGKGKQIREWLHVADCARAIYTVLEKGQLKEIYNIGSNFERDNLNTVKTILNLLGKPLSLIEFVPDRPGHDFRYSVNCAKIRKLGWSPQIGFLDGIKGTIDWYAKNQGWVKGKMRKK